MHDRGSPMGLKSHLSEFLLKKADAHYVPVLDVGFVPSLPSRILDSDEPHPESTPLPSSPDAEGQTFVICYVNAKAAQSTRRLTVHALKRTSEARVLLFARCAETREVMSFRADRIKYCMDVTGEIYEPPAMFLVGIFGLGPSDAELLAAETAGRGITWSPKDEACCVLRQQLRNELILLTAVADPDGRVSPVEPEAIPRLCAQAVRPSRYPSRRSPHVKVAGLHPPPASDRGPDQRRHRRNLGPAGEGADGYGACLFGSDAGRWRGAYRRDRAAGEGPGRSRARLSVSSSSPALQRRR